MCHGGHGGDVEAVELGIADDLGVDRLGVGPDGGGEVRRVARVHKRHLDAQSGQVMREEVVGAAVERARRNDVVAGTGYVEQCESDSRRAAGKGEGADAAFQRREALLKHVGGRVHDPRVYVARLGEGEQVLGVLGVVEHVRGCLVNGHGAGVGGRVWSLTAMQGQRLEAGRPGAVCVFSHL